MRHFSLLSAAAILCLGACSPDASTSPRSLRPSAAMDPQSPGNHLQVVFKRGPAPNTVIASTDPADIQDVASQVVSDPAPAATAALRQRANAAWRVKPDVALIDESLPSGVVARVVRPADGAGAPTIVVSRSSVSLDIIDMARLALARDIVVTPSTSNERTVDLYANDTVVGSDGTSYRMDRSENVGPGVEKRRIFQAHKLSLFFAKFGFVPPTQFRGKSARIVHWP